MDTHIPGLTVAGGWLQWAFEPLAAPAVGAVEEVTVGIIADDAETAGDVPVPTDPRGTHADWMWHQVGYSTVSRPSAIFDGSAGPMIRFRAKRRFDEVGTRLWFVAISSVAGTLRLQTSTLLLS